MISPQSVRALFCYKPPFAVYVNRIKLVKLVGVYASCLISLSLHLCSCPGLPRCSVNGEGSRGRVSFTSVFTLFTCCSVVRCSLVAQLGAVDILQKPISSQTGRLGTLWQHTLRKRSHVATTFGGSESHNTSSGAGSTAAETAACTAGDDLVKAILPDLFEVDIWDEQNTIGASGEHGSSIDTPETPDISHHLRQDFTSSQSLISCYHNELSPVHSGSSIGRDHMVKAHSVTSALSPVLVPQVCSTFILTFMFEL